MLEGLSVGAEVGGDQGFLRSDWSVCCDGVYAGCCIFVKVTVCQTGLAPALVAAANTFVVSFVQQLKQME